MRLSGNRYEEIKREIYYLFLDYGISVLPVDVFYLCQQMKIKLVAYSTLSNNKKSGIFMISNDGFSFFDSVNEKGYVIYYNDEGISERRQRFTIMHEIGHIVLEHNEDTIYEIAESEANFFARNALAPIPILLTNNLVDVYDIYETFNVSFECAEITFNALSKRIRYGHIELKDYEQKLLDLFGMKVR